MFGRLAANEGFEVVVTIKKTDSPNTENSKILHLLGVTVVITSFFRLAVVVNTRPVISVDSSSAP